MYSFQPFDSSALLLRFCCPQNLKDPYSHIVFHDTEMWLESFTTKFPKFVYADGLKLLPYPSEIHLNLSLFH